MAYRQDFPKLPTTGYHKELSAIQEYYGNRTAERSKVPLINHIKEGLTVLENIKASTQAKAAYCLHPILQSDEALKKAMVRDEDNFDLLDHFTDPYILVLVMEYRKVANAYLPPNCVGRMDRINLSPIEEVNDMLRADKVQNYKDFLTYHRASHENADKLDMYFKNWLYVLGINNRSFITHCKIIDSLK